MTKQEIAIEIRKAARQHALPQWMLICIVCQESSGNPNAERYEQGFFDKYLAGKTPKQLGGVWPEDPDEIQLEYRHRATSYGLCQVMLQVAREFGFKGSVADLKEPRVNLYWACRKLVRLRSRYGKDQDSILLYYNGGGDPKYPARVKKWIKSPLYSQLYIA